MKNKKDWTMKNKRGWTKIVESVMAVLLIALFLMFILEQREASNMKDVSREIFDAQDRILKEIQLNNSLREEILKTTPPQVSTLDEGFPPNLKNFLIQKIPENLDCEAKICNLTNENLCSIEEDYKKISEGAKKNIYVRQILIFSEGETHSPKILKIFCWR